MPEGAGEQRSGGGRGRGETGTRGRGELRDRSESVRGLEWKVRRESVRGLEWKVRRESVGNRKKFFEQTSPFTSSLPHLFYSSLQACFCIAFANSLATSGRENSDGGNSPRRSISRTFVPER